MISYQKEKYNWEFIFLGANIDALETASRYGISANRVSNFVCDSAGVNLNFSVVSKDVSSLRKKSEIADDWAEEIQADYKQRSR